MRLRPLIAALTGGAAALAAAGAQATTFKTHTHRLRASPSSPAYTVSLGLPPRASYAPTGGGNFELKATSAGQRLAVYGTMALASVVRSDPSGRSSVLKQAGRGSGQWIAPSVYLVPGGVNTYLIAIHGGAALHLCLQDYPQDHQRDALIRAIALHTSGALG